MQKPVLQRLLQRLPDGRLTRDLLEAEWPAGVQSYRLTLGRWGGERRYWSQGWYQTSRPGQNLVLQLNFSNRHDEPYRRYVRPRGYDPFSFSCHPNAENGLRTLAWARLDLDLDRGEALIEEVQSDWVREAKWYRDHAGDYCLRAGEPRSTVEELPYWRFACTEAELRHYVDAVLAPYAAVWEEAMLAAAVWFLRTELGLRRIFYHSAESGDQLKGLARRSSRPPRSLYSQLPRRFCFRPTGAVPEFLMQERRVRNLVRRSNWPMYLLEL